MCFSTVPSVAAHSLPADPCPARTLSPHARQQLALHALAGTAPLSQLAQTAHVSRTFLYRQTDTARHALQNAFDPPTPDPHVLFHLPVTTRWLRQFTLALCLHCHSSYRGVLALLQDCFDTSLSIGTIHNILHDAVETARQHNASSDLSSIRIGAHDEIFQHGQPVLVGADVRSTFCYLLSLEEHRDADTWGIRLLELQEQGLRPDATIADAGQGLRAGQKAAWPNTPCRGDVFHAVRDLGQLVRFLDNRAFGLVDACDQQERRMARAKKKGRGNTHSKRLAILRQQQAQAIRLADEVTVLVGWLREEILAVAGPIHSTRCQLFDFVASELEAREQLCPHRIGPIVRALRNQRDDLLAFAVALDEQLAALAEEFQVSPALVREVLQVNALEACSSARWQRDAELHRRLGSRYWEISKSVASVAGQTVRASSVIENLNSRLRSYFFLRRHLGGDYLELLRFYLNHRRFARSEHPERVGKSPAELLTGQTHRHWLELLGYQRFERN